MPHSPTIMPSSLLRFATAGSVDDGKSTLIGRLLVDARGVYQDQIDALRSASPEGKLDLALVTDGLKAEREQGITIDVAYRYFNTARRKFIIADTPGHEQYTRNMATGASTAQLVLLLIDARKGVITQTRRHAFIASLLGIQRFVIAVNKIDLVDFSQAVFEKIRADFESFAVRLSIPSLDFIPVSALYGDNVISRSPRTPWYHGPSLLDQLETSYVDGDRNLIDFRFPVQWVIRAQRRAYAGQLHSGVVRPGDAVVVLPSMRRSVVRRIVTWEGNLSEAFAPMSVALELEDELDVGRGDLIVRTDNIPTLTNHLEAMAVWMGDDPLDTDRTYLLKHTTRLVKARVDTLRYATDVNTLRRTQPETLSLNGIGRLAISTHQPLFVDHYNQNRHQGCFILIDPDTHHTVAAGMILDRQSSEPSSQHSDSDFSGAPGFPSPPAAPQLLTPVGSRVGPGERAQLLGHRPLTVWLTGLSGAGKSTIARELEARLFGEQVQVSRLDGDNLRGGLNRDLGFSAADRSENIRRAAEVARLFNDAGAVVLVACIAPYAADRQRARATIGARRFMEVHIHAPLEVCERRDPKGLYRRARQGLLQDFTGVDAPYEEPRNPDLRLDTSERDLQSCLDRLIRAVLERIRPVGD